MLQKKSSEEIPLDKNVDDKGKSDKSPKKAKEKEAVPKKPTEKRFEKRKVEKDNPEKPLRIKAKRDESFQGSRKVEVCTEKCREIDGEREFAAGSIGEEEKQQAECYRKGFK